MMCLFVAVYQETSGTVAWVYAAETTQDAGLGCAFFTLWSTVFILSLVCPPLMNPDLLGPSNMFFMFSGLSAIAVFFCWFYMKETRGLTDKEKKSLYFPKEFKNFST